MRIRITVPTDSDYWDNHATDDEAQVWAQRHADRMEAWARKNYPGADIDVVLVPETFSYDGQSRVICDDIAREQDILDEINSYSEATFACAYDA